MTLIVGILCKDGIVVASDSAATFGDAVQRTIGQQDKQKVLKLNDHMIFSSSGGVGMSQIISDRLKRLWDENKLSGSSLKSPEEVGNKIGIEICGLVTPYFQTGQYVRNLTGAPAESCLCKSLLAIPVKNVPCLFNFDFSGTPEISTPELPFISLGSGQAIADPFLALLRRVLWSSSEPTVAEGRLAAVWTIEHVTKTNPGGVGGPIQLSTLVASDSTIPRVEMASPSDISEHHDKVLEVEAALVAELRGTRGDPAPPVPLPETSSE